MKKLLSITFLAFLVSLNAFSQGVYLTKTGDISFFSHAPLEDILAESKSMSSAINIKTNKISCKVKISTLKMENSLQQEHLNEKYLESHKYPYATFTGDIIGTVNWTKDGTYPIKVKGKLKLHGVEKERTIIATIMVKAGVISSKSTFKVKVEDHNVEIPKLVFQKVAEEVEIKLHATYKVLPNKK